MIIKKSAVFVSVISMLIIPFSCKREGGIVYNEKEKIYIDSDVRITSIENHAVIPQNYFYPLVEVNGKDGVDLSLKIEADDKKLIVPLVNNKWKPADDSFKQFLNSREITFSVHYKQDGQSFRGKKIKVFVASARLDERIIYRLVEPFFNPSQPSMVQILDLNKPGTRSLVTADTTCIGCHSYSPRVDIMNVKKESDRRIVIISKEKRKSYLKQKMIGQFSFFATTSDGKHTVIAANTAGKISLYKNIIEPFDLVYLTGDVFVFDMKTETLQPLNGAAELDYVEDMPSFSHDNKQVVFSRYKVEGEAIEEMDLYLVPFNNGNGGKALPVRNASQNGMYHYFARFSPDGEWLSFCRGMGKNGIFARESSDIFLMNITDFSLRKLDCNLENKMDSWHFWSSDSRWLIFASKREKNNMSSLYLTYIDEQGHDHPPLKLIGYNKYKVNIPQFVKRDTSFDYSHALAEYLKAIYRK